MLKINGRIVLLLIFLLLCACNKKASEHPIEINETPIVLIDSEVDDEKHIEEIALSFYEWYLQSPLTLPTMRMIKTDAQGKCLFDIEPYCSDLRSLGTISEKFIISEQQRLKPCIDHLAQYTYAEFEASDGLELIGEVCSEFEYDYWTRSQDPYDKIRSENLVVENDSAIVDAQLYGDAFESGGEVNVRILLERENGNWKIVRIEFPDQEKQPDNVILYSKDVN